MKYFNLDCLINLDMNSFGDIELFVITVLVRTCLKCILFQQKHPIQTPRSKNMVEMAKTCIYYGPNVVQIIQTYKYSSSWHA